MKYKRVLLKLSGEALAGDDHFGINANTVADIARQIKEAKDLGVEIAIVCGGGNIWRGVTGAQMGMERSSADYMGMLATVMNGLAVQNALEQLGIQTRLLSAIEMRQIAEPYIRRRAVRHLEKGRIVIFGAGTGSPYFTTDTTAALRAAEINADVILMAKNGVDGVYSADPKLDESAVKFDEISYSDVLAKDLKVMDQTAITLCKDNDIDLCVFNMQEDGNIAKACDGQLSLEENNMINMILDDASDRMQKAIEAYQRDLATVRTGRATPAMLDRVMVNYYGSPTPINQMAGVSVVEGRQLVIKPFDKSALKDIEHGIYEADLGLTPQNDGEIIRITVPALTEERRKEYAKNVWKFAEHAKVAIRNIRRDANDEIKKCDGSEDEIKDGQNRVQKLTDKFVKEVDEIGKVKEKDIMTV